MDCEDAVRFKERADKLVDQYDQIIVIDTLHANGRFTLGENIADHGGLLVAHQAYLNSLKGKETPARSMASRMSNVSSWGMRRCGDKISVPRRSVVVPRSTRIHWENGV